MTFVKPLEVVPTPRSRLQTALETYPCIHCHGTGIYRSVLIIGARHLPTCEPCPACAGGGRVKGEAKVQLAKGPLPANTDSGGLFTP